jgi:hypothetical protein
MLFKVSWLNEKTFWCITDATGVEAKQGQLFGRYEVKAVVLVCRAEMNPECVGCGDGTLPLRMA